MAGWQPTWRVLIAFQDSVFTDPATITSIATPAGTLGAIPGIWTDITPWVRDGIDTNRGRQHEIDRFQTGTMALSLDNRDGRFDPWNTAGPYTGKIAPGYPVRLQAVDPNTSAVTNLFTGITDVWTTGWAEPNRSIVQLSCVDWFAYLTNSYVQSNMYAQTVLADSPTTYHRLGDPAGSNHLHDSSGHNFTAIPAAVVVLGTTGGLVNDVATGADLANGGNTPAGAVYLNPSGAITANSWAIECWYKTSSWSAWGGRNGDTNNSLFYESTPTGYLTVYINNLGTVFLDSFLGATERSWTASATIPADGNWHHLVCQLGGGSDGVWLDSNAVAGSLITSGSPTFAPQWARVGYNGDGPRFPGSLQELAVYNGAALSPARITAHYSAGAAPVETSDARIVHICSWLGIPTANAVLDAGNSRMQLQSQPLATTSTLSYLQLVEQTEDGALFMNGSGQLRFMSRNSVYVPTTATVTFGDNTAGGEIPFELAPTIATDTQDQYIKTIIQRNNGMTQIADSGMLGKTYSQSGLLQTNDTEVLGMANWLLGQFSGTPKPRIRSITVHPVVTPAGTATTALLAMQLMDVVTVNRHTLPGAGTAFSQTCNVEGINHHIDPSTGDWNVLLELTPLAPHRPWILGTSQLGVDTTLFF